MQLLSRSRRTRIFSPAMLTSGGICPNFRSVVRLAALNQGRCSYSKLKNGSAEARKEPDDRMDSFVENLVSTKSQRWQNKTKSRSNWKTTNAVKVVAAIKTKEVLEEETLSKEKIVPLTVLQNAVNDPNFDQNEVLKVLESPHVVAQVQPELLVSLAEAFVNSDFADGILQLEASSQRLSTPPACNFIGLQFKKYRELNETTKALGLVEKFYVGFPNSRREARSYMATVIKDVVANHSEAVLVQLRQLVFRLEANYGDSRPLIFLWHACFISEWFSDQQLARELLSYISKRSALVLTLDKKLMTATYMALGRHRPELVQNLIEDLISNNLHPQLTVPMRLLFDYRCSMRDLKGCAAIMKSSTELKVYLTSKQHSEFLTLLTNKKHFRWKDPPPQKKIEVEPTVDYKFKF